MDTRWSLPGKRAVVTGGTQGIGRATADVLLDLGASVPVVARNPRGVESTRREWKDSGRDGDAVVVDVTSGEGRATLAGEVSARWGAVDLLVNNVGAGLRKRFAECTEEDVDALVSLNFKSALHVSPVLFPLLARGSDAAVVNVGSIADVVSVRGPAVYGALKARLQQLSSGAGRRVGTGPDPGQRGGPLVHAHGAHGKAPRVPRGSRSHCGAHTAWSSGRGARGGVGHRISLPAGLVVRDGPDRVGRRGNVDRRISLNCTVYLCPRCKEAIQW